MPVIPESVNDFTVLKSLLYFLVETTENLGIMYIFSHCDEAVYSKLLQIIGKEGDQFSKVIPPMGGFRQVLCLQKAIYKRYACLGLDKWITGVATIKSSLVAENTVHVLHYNTSIRVYKEIFDAIVQMRMEDITNMYVNIDEELLSNLINLRKSTCAKNMSEIVVIEEFQILEKDITTVTSRQSQVTVMLLEDISLPLTFIVAALETNIDRNFQ